MPKRPSISPATEVARERPLPLVDALRTLPSSQLRRISAMLDLKLVREKRIDDATQIARALVGSRVVRDAAQLPIAEQQLMLTLAEHGGAMTFAEPPDAIAALAERGLVFAVEVDGGTRVHLPIALLLQLPSWDGEDPTSVRALLARCEPGAAAAIASYHLGRTATHPLKLALEAAWIALTDSRQLRESLRDLAPAERDLLGQIEKLGGEVSTEELLELEHEPMRLRTATGTAPARRGIGFSLERRGFLIPLHPDRHVIPAEVLRVVGERPRQRREELQAKLLQVAETSGHEPVRANFGTNPAPLALALALNLRYQRVTIKHTVGTPTSLVQKMAARFGADKDTVCFLAALGRVAGLWDVSADNPDVSPGSITVGALPGRLFSVWMSGGGWNEALPEGETWRVADSERLRSPVAQLRSFVTSALRELAADRWVPLTIVEDYIRGEHRMGGLERLLSRWSKKARVDINGCQTTVHRILTESLPQLGCVDLAVDESSESEPAQVIRVSSLGKRLLRGSGYPPAAATTANGSSSEFEGRVLTIGENARLGVLMQLGRAFDVGAVDRAAQLVLNREGVARAISEGVEPEALREQLESLAELSPPVDRLLSQASELLGEAEFIPADGFLWIADSSVRKELAMRRTTRALFVDPSPPSGLLVQKGVTLDTLVRRCRQLGVQIIAEGGVLVADIKEAGEVAAPSRSGTRRKVGATKKIRRAKTGTD